MRTINDLKQTFSEHEPTATDLSGILDAAASRAHRLRRRRRLGAIGAPALAVAAVIAAASFLTPPHSNTAQSAAPSAVTPEPSGAPSTTPPRPVLRPGHTTIDLIAGSKYVKLSQGTHHTTQIMTLRARDGEAASFGGEVVVHDPNTFDASHLLSAEPVEIPGRGSPGFYLAPDTLGWRNAHGFWIVITGDSNREGLVRTMQDVTFVAEYVLKTPYRFTYWPDGIDPVYVSLIESGARGGFNTSGRPGTVSRFGMIQDLAISVTVLPLDEYLKSHTPAQKDAVKINGNNVWFLDGSNAGSAGLMLKSGAGAITITNQHCHALIMIARVAEVPRAEQEKIAAGFSFADCRNPGKWVEPFS